jgi:hypothetical protein
MDDNREPNTSAHLVDQDIAMNEVLQGIWIPNGLEITCNEQSEPYPARVMNEDCQGTFNLTPMERFLACAGPWNALGVYIDTGGANVPASQ